MKSCIFIVVCFAIILSIMGFQPSSYRYRKASISSGSSLKMNMFDRFFRVVKSNVNGVLSNLEDPEKVRLLNTAAPHTITLNFVIVF